MCGGRKFCSEFFTQLFEYRCCQFWSKVMTSEVEERPRFVTGGYGRHKSQWVKKIKPKKTKPLHMHNFVSYLTFM